MKGWKTWASGIGAILTGLGMIGAALASDTVDWEVFKTGLLTIIGGLGLIGIGHKVEKLAAFLSGGKHQFPGR